MSRSIVTKATKKLCVWESAAIDKSVNFEGINRIFGYGSLCWTPPCDEKFIASRETCYVNDLKRRFYNYSCDHRGTPENPGLVVTLLGKDHPDYSKASTLTKENQVFGLCFTIEDSYLDTLLPELDYRERHGYTRTLVETYDPKTNKSKGKAIVYLAEPGNDPAYAGVLAEDDIASIITKSKGPSGMNLEYFNLLLEFCESHGWNDEHLQKIKKYF